MKGEAIMRRIFFGGSLVLGLAMLMWAMAPVIAAHGLAVAVVGMLLPAGMPAPA